MDLQKIIADILGKLKLDTGLLDKFKKSPIETVKSLLGSLKLGDVKFDEGQIKAIADGVTAKLGVDDAVKQGGGFLSKLKSLFGGKK